MSSSSTQIVTEMPVISSSTITTTIKKPAPKVSSKPLQPANAIPSTTKVTSPSTFELKTLHHNHHNHHNHNTTSSISSTNPPYNANPNANPNNNPHSDDASIEAAVIEEEGERAVTEEVEEETRISRAVALKLLSCGFSFFFAGVNDGALGTLLPYFRAWYGIGLGKVTVIYLTTFLGWLLAGLTNTLLLSLLPPPLLLLLGATLQLLSQLLRLASTNSYPLFCFTFALTSLGLAYQDSHANTFVSTVKGAHRALGFIHAMYAVGLLVAPFVANAIALGGKGEGGKEWGRFYYVLVGMGVVNLAGVVGAFREGLRRGRRGYRREGGGAGSVTGVGAAQGKGLERFKRAMRESWDTVKVDGVWQLSLFYFFWLGGVFASAGFLVEYLTLVRGAPLQKMGYVPTANYGGTVLGRLLLPEITHRLGERRMILVYCALWLGLQLVFWLVPDVVGDVVAIGLIGFFVGPFFATGISVASKLFDRRHKPAALGFIFIAAQAGGALFPTLTGLVAAHAGVRVLQPIVVGLIVAAAGSWLLVPKVARHVE